MPRKAASKRRPTSTRVAKSRRRRTAPAAAVPAPVSSIVALDADGLARAEMLGLAVDGGETLALTRRGRFLGGGVTAEILA